MSQKMSKRYRKALDKMYNEQEQFRKMMDLLRRRPPVWRVFSYIKWEIEWRKIL